MKILIAMLSILMLLLGLLISSLVYVINQDSEVRYVETIKEVPVVVTKEVVVERNIIKETEANSDSIICTVTAAEPIQLKDWDSVDELKVFAFSVNPRLDLVTNSEGYCKLDFTGRCGYYAYQMRDQAKNIGKYLSVQVMTPQELAIRFPTVDNPGKEYHALCMARMGNELYCIEPTTDEVQLCYTIK